MAEILNLRLLANLTLKRLFNIALFKKKTHTNLLKKISFSFQTMPAEKIQVTVRVYFYIKTSSSVTE